MTKIFSFDVSWLPQSHGGDPPISSTAASLTIRVGDQIATRNEDEWSKSVETSARLAAYPLACWLASCWWRLRWESESPRNMPGPDWRMAHEIAGAGHGFLWPNLTFVSDSECVQVLARPTNPLSKEPVRFLADFAGTIPAHVFERAVDEFIELVLARLHSMRQENTGLELLWNEVNNERRDPALATRRRFEAALGFDPQEAPPTLLERMIALSTRAGDQAAEEIAPACAGPEPTEALDAIEEIASSPGVESGAEFAQTVRKQLELEASFAIPWERGRSLAREVRRTQGWKGKPLSDALLAELLGIRSSDLQPSWADVSAPVVGLAVRQRGNNTLRLHFRKRNPAGLRFEAARLLCEQLIAPESDNWLPATDTRTSRQKTQRAFAAELLCPIDDLDDFLSGDYSPERIEDAAEHFKISPLVVSSHLANNNRISRLTNAL